MLFDQTISNSGKLPRLLREITAERGWPEEVELVADRILRRSCKEIVATTDSGILDCCGL